MYDYIVIGAGTAGCTLAARLSEDPAIQVLLIEAGPPNRSSAIRTPLAFPQLFRSRVDWSFWTEPQEHLDNRRVYWPRGKVLGGSGSINSMVHTLPCRADLDAWGMPGWSYDEVAQPAGVPVSKDPNPLTEAFLKACEAVGLPLKAALPDASEPACGLFPVDVRNGARYGAAEQYLRPALRRGNLTVWANIAVARVAIEAGRAVGVEYMQGSSVSRVEASREVILCAGAVGSPQLLLLSGVGPRADLERHGVAMAVELDGVGASLQDHLAAPLSFGSTQAVSLTDVNTLANRIRHRLRATGPLASNGAEAGAFFKSKNSEAACNLELVFAPVHFVDHGFAKPCGHGFSLIPVLLTPQSRGRVALASADPREAPKIDPAYLSHPMDLAPLAEGVRFARRVVEQSAFAPFRGTPVQEQIDPEEYVRAWGQTLYHPVGTCRMGTDLDSVVDAALRVHGVAGLRVADASVIPVIPRAHTNAVTGMIAEKAARLLREA